MTADTSQAKQQLKQLQQQLTNLTKSVNSTSRMSITQDILDASKAAQQLKIQLEQATNVKTGKLDLGMFQQQLKQSGMSLEKYRDQLIKMGPDGAKAFSVLASSITKAEIPIKRSNALLSEGKSYEPLAIRSQYLQQNFPRTIAILESKLSK